MPCYCSVRGGRGGTHGTEPGGAGSGEQPGDRETLLCLEGLMHRERGQEVGTGCGEESWGLAGVSLGFCCHLFQPQ